MSENTPSTKSFRNHIFAGAGLGALSGLTLVAFLYLGERWFGLPFVPFDIFDWMTRTLPGGLIAGVIRFMVILIEFFQSFLPIGNTSTVAKLAEQSIAIGQLVAGGAIFGAALAWLRGRSLSNLVLYGQLGGLGLLAVTLIIEYSLETVMMTAGSVIWLALLFFAWGWGLARLIEPALKEEEKIAAEEITRRQFLKVSGAGLSAAALGTWGIAQLFGDEAVESIADSSTSVEAPIGDPFGTSLTSGPAASPSLEELAARPAAVSGTRPEMTPLDDYYRIDINTRPSEIDIESWRLKVTGRINQPVDLTIDQIRSYPSQEQILTMQCISNSVGGDLTSSTRWKGVRFKDLMEDLGMDTSAAGAYIESSDGFYEFVIMEDIMDDRTLLVYDMNGEPLRVKHGFPLRVYIPGRYGMKQPKWITSIEIADEWVEGYWVERGWSREAFVKTVSVVDTVAVDSTMGENGTALAGGIAWASSRGISKVEVQINDGGWQEAELINPPLSPLNWVLWRIGWDYTPGRYDISVRAFDGDGILQAVEDRAPRPNGASGIHSTSVNI
jgi:DMSO/TMAO reductase YedYZ molybdopterin-dependent catalytic subunit